MSWHHHFSFSRFSYTIYLMRKTKIVITVGPATKSPEMLEELLRAGANIFRLNFSQANTEEHQRRLDSLRVAIQNTGISAEVIQDLAGPKIRIGLFKTNPITLKEGDTFTLTTDNIEGDQTRVSVNYPLITKEVLPGEFVFIDDGTKKLQVKEVQGNDMICKVLIGGEVRNQKGVNLPGSKLSVKSLTEKDRADLEFGIKNKVDYVALSFVRSSADIAELREILDSRGCAAKIIAKVETPQALDDIDGIIKLSDVIMVARGDLAIEIPFEKVPIFQKIITEKCNEVGKPTIIATQMMESMVENERPTRAEASDVANAVLDGAEAVMLSEETAMGKYPIEVVKDMAKIIDETEKDAGLVKTS